MPLVKYGTINMGLIKIKLCSIVNNIAEYRIAKSGER